jgi:hypothetical protein
MLRDVLSGESIENNEVVVIAPTSRAFDKDSRVLNQDLYAVSDFKIEVGFCDTNHGGIDFNNVDGCLGIQITERRWQGSAAQSNNENRARSLIEQQASEGHPHVREHNPIGVFEINAGLSAVIATLGEYQTAIATGFLYLDVSVD